MSKKLVNRILLVNDDGIDAPGIIILKNIAERLANEVWIVAPALDQSGVSCAVSLKAPFRVAKRSPTEYAVYGTPADCSLFALKYLMKDCLPDLVLSGINNGSNVGFETILSGTVGAAMMAMTLGIPAMALSQLSSEDNKPTEWDSSIQHAETIIRQLLALTTPKNIIFNINFPACSAKQVKGTKITKQGAADVSNFIVAATKDPEGDDYFWFRAKRNQQVFDEEKELDAANSGYIAITPISYERTDYCFYQQLQQQFEHN
ncbi:5'/3'-nucleotidase SurE [Gilliamella sp. wkB112]|uniref:5'/3'-nucleotidase SurE n=1 Tax=Gilliamella sp. wkB112 TaxID=3120257 RepID=UPI00080E202F|nr:5'/3'-nucleotidase SurE [Gilliamella apicola]OCG01180.1 5'/3'-nucleotidase SurE [Gilliamella apicola]